MKRAIGLLILTALSLCSQAVPGRSVFADVPERARARLNPQAKDRDAPAEGGKVFQQHCTPCHGKTAEGSRVAPALINPEMHAATPGEIFWVVSNGVVDNGMPSWSRLPETQRWQIVAFLGSLNGPNAGRGLVGGTNAATPVVFTKPAWSQPLSTHVRPKYRAKRNPLANDPDAPTAGLKLFQQHCTQCHGIAGEGTRRAPGLVSVQMQAATPGEIFWILTNGLVRHGMPSWSQLPAVQRWQIITFLSSMNGHQVPPAKLTSTKP
jgi:mono/diheme cytochrome c family protein